MVAVMVTFALHFLEDDLDSPGLIESFPRPPVDFPVYWSRDMDVLFGADALMVNERSLERRLDLIRQDYLQHRTLKELYDSHGFSGSWSRLSVVALVDYRCTLPCANSSRNKSKPSAPLLSSRHSCSSSLVLLRAPPRVPFMPRRMLPCA